MSQPAGSPLHHTHIQDLWIEQPMPPSEKNEVQVIGFLDLFGTLMSVKFLKLAIEELHFAKKNEYFFVLTEDKIASPEGPC